MLSRSLATLPPNATLQIVDYSTSKTGKHGHAKAKIAALDIFTGKRLEDAMPTSHNMDAPVGTQITAVMSPRFPFRRSYPLLQPSLIP